MTKTLIKDMLFKDTLVIYHASCTDGFAAAWIARNWFKEFNINVSFFHAHYNTPPPVVKNRTVFLLDFSYPSDVLEKIIEEADSVIIVDHHISAFKDITSKTFTKDFYYYYNEGKCGAMLTWEYFYADSNYPELLAHIDDRDRWKFLLPYTKEIMEAVNSYPMSFESWDILMDDSNIGRLIEEGIVLTRKSSKQIEEALKKPPLRICIGNHIVDSYNLTTNISEVLNRMVEERDIPFSASFFMTPDGYIFSLRSIDSKEDVSQIASLYGGGGHRNAAGFKVKRLEDLDLAAN